MSTHGAENPSSATHVTPDRADPARVERNLDAWKQLLRAEDARLGALQLPAALVTVGLDRARDRERALGLLEALLRPTDRVGVLCEDEFSVLLVPLTDIHDAQRMVQHVADGLRAAGVDAHLGWAMRQAGHGIFNAMARADAAMLTAKGHGHAALDLAARERPSNPA